MGQAAVIASCSFCMKPNTEVASLVAGPGVYICDGCVELAAQIIADKPERRGTGPDLPVWELAAGLDDVLANLLRIAAASDQVDRTLAGWVSHARKLGASWSQIGEALGMARQSAWERFNSRRP